MRLSDAITDYIDAKTNFYSPNTLNDYGLTFRRAQVFFDEDPFVQDLDNAHIRRFLKTIPGGDKNRMNAHIALSSLWTFLLKENKVDNHVLHNVEIVKPNQVLIFPFSDDESRRLIRAAMHSQNARRDEAIIKVLFDTGIRASECMGLRLEDLKGEFLTVTGKSSKGKGPKVRQVPVSASTLRAILEYIINDRKAAPRRAALFASSRTDGYMSRFSLGLLCDRLAHRAMVENVFPHRCRHTFAVNYLLNGGDPYTLQDILGHTTMDMVKRYLHFVNHNLARMHRKASPISNWQI
ncbi:tyrosine-type recombinase/integrase [candidate division KSB1 bacterium]|nr:tyrosine-type recombinase/integrase [candidate division KSB1 bacterium]